MKFCDPKRFAFAKNRIMFFVNGLNAHEGNILDGMIGRLKVLNDREFFLMKLDVRLG